MEFVANREVLLPALSKVIGVVERRQTLPILGNLLLSAEGERLTITGSDLEVEVRTELAAEILKPGEITVPARKLVDIVRNLGDYAEVRMRLSDERCVLTAGRSRFSLGVLPAADFPHMEIDEVQLGFRVEEPVLKRLLDKTAFAMAQQDVRYYLNGLLMELNNLFLTTVATDGHRLARYRHRMDCGVADTRRVIVPSKTVLELKRQLSNSENSVEIVLGSKSIRFLVDRLTMTSKLVDGTYPEYERVIPRDIGKLANIHKEELKRALARTAILSNEKYRGVSLSFSAGLLKLKAHNPEQEEAEEEIAMDYDGEPTTIGFNVGYLTDALSAADGEEVQVQFENANSSSVWRGKGAEDETYVVMPMRL